MSVPIALAAFSAIASAASTAISIKQQNDQASAMEQAAITEYGNNLQQQEIQNRQISEVKGQQVSERAKESLRQRAKLRVLSGESGLQGATINRLNQEIDYKEGYDLSIIEQNFQNQNIQTYFQNKSIESNTKSQLNQAASMKTTGVGAGLQIGLSAASGAISGYSTGGGFNTNKK